MSKPIMEAKGNNGQVELYKDKIKIKRKGFVAKIAHFGKGSKEIPIENITSVQFKEAGYVTAGYIQFGQSGYSEDDGGVMSAAKDENSVNFNRGSGEEFKKLKEKINTLRNKSKDNSSKKDDTALETLKKRFAEGEISEEEYKRRKTILQDE